jgi:hypothetical protein
MIGWKNLKTNYQDTTMKNLLSIIALFLVFGFVASNANGPTVTKSASFKFNVAWTPLAIADVEDVTIADWTITNSLTYTLPANTKMDFAISGATTAPIFSKITLTPIARTMRDGVVTTALLEPTVLSAAGTATASVTLGSITFSEIPTPGAYSVLASCSAYYIY